VRVLALQASCAASRFLAQKRSLFSVNALVVIDQEPSVHAGLHVAGLRLNDTYRMTTPNHGTGESLAQQFTK
jgi:hypothetical protein